MHKSVITKTFYESDVNTTLNLCTTTFYSKLQSYIKELLATQQLYSGYIPSPLIVSLSS